MKNGCSRFGASRRGRDARSAPVRLTALAPDGLATCLGCGTCCFSRLATYVRVTGDDYARLGESLEAAAPAAARDAQDADADLAASLVRFGDNQAYMRMTDGHCAALLIERDDGGEGRFVCSVYEGRPQVCRDLARGSGECRGEIASKADRPLLALLALTRMR